MTATKPRHKYFAIRLLNHFIPMGKNIKVFIEKYEDDTPKNYNIKDEAETPLIKKHFQDFDKIEKEFFDDFNRKNKDILEKNIIRITSRNTINNEENVKFLKKLNPKLVVVYATSIIKDLIINLFPRRMLNMHAGLSPYYRGSGTNLYPFYNDELEYTGMTSMYINAGIDSGDIITQGRPVFEENDNTHTIGCKCAAVGADIMIAAVDRYLTQGPPPCAKQDLSKGRLYLRKHFNDEVIAKTYDNIKNGMVKRYCKNPKKARMIIWGEEKEC